MSETDYSKQFDNMLSSCRKALASFDGTGDPDAQGGITEQLRFLMLRQRLTREALLRPLEQRLSQDHGATEALSQYLRSRQRVEDLDKITAEVNAYLEALLQRPLHPEESMNVGDAAAEVLRTVRHPMHYREIEENIRMSGIILGGKDPAATLRAYLQRDERFERAPNAGRGFYILQEWKDQIDKVR